MQLTLTPEEAVVLRNVLSVYLPQLREEIAKTERYELRQALKRDEVIVKELLETLNGLAGVKL